MRIAIEVYGTNEIEAAFRSFTGPFQSRLLGPSLAEMARPVRDAAKQRNFGFTDRFGPPVGRSPYRSLRQSIRVRRIGARYGGRSYRTGRAAVIAGGGGARQAHLVELGHGGPRPARPHSFLVAALVQRQGQLGQAFGMRARAIFPRLVGANMLRGRSGTLGASFGRTVPRRARRR